MAWDEKRKKALRTRFTIGPLLLLAIGLIYYADTHWGGNGHLSAALLGILGLVGLWEFVAMWKEVQRPVATGPLMLIGLATFLEGPRSLSMGQPWLPMLYLWTGSFVLLLGSMLWGLSRKRHEQAVEAAAAALLGYLWIVAPMYLGQKMAMWALPMLLFVVLVSKGGDIGAYLVGSAIGKRKLIPHVSPGKTVEGFVGSLLTSCLLAWLLGGWIGDPSLTVWGLLLMGLAINLATQLGDLSESLLKRSCGVKDSSTLLPEHGGILDLVDSLLFAIPVFILMHMLLT
jgi:phosphatidate cytidylyltransferase